MKKKKKAYAQDRKNTTKYTKTVHTCKTKLDY